MNEFLRNNGMEVIFFTLGTIAIVALIVCITIGTMNGNQHYYEAVKHCVDSLGTWVPSNNVGLCLMNNVQISH